MTAPRPKVWLPRGLPGSGKSSLFLDMRTRYPNLARVSRDDARATMFNQTGRLSHEQEDVITKAEHAQAVALLATGFDVFVDATNLRARWCRKWANLAALNGAGFEVIELRTAVDECVRRDAARERSVGEAVIREYARKFPYSTWEPITASPELVFEPEPYTADETLPPAWIVDLDGTLSSKSDRGIYDYTRVGEDTPIEHTVTIVRKLAEDASIIILSGRDDECREQTAAWLRAHAIPFDAIHMRATGDRRPDFLAKTELFDKHIRHQYRVMGVIDDRLSVCRAWDRMGLPLIRLGRPDKDDF